MMVQPSTPVPMEAKRTRSLGGTAPGAAWRGRGESRVVFAAAPRAATPALAPINSPTIHLMAIHESKTSLKYSCNQQKSGKRPGSMPEIPMAR